MDAHRPTKWLACGLMLLMECHAATTTATPARSVSVFTTGAGNCATAKIQASRRPSGEGTATASAPHVGNSEFESESVTIVVR